MSVPHYIDAYDWDWISKGAPPRGETVLFDSNAVAEDYTEYEIYPP
jgi:hypothetical protein